DDLSLLYMRIEISEQPGNGARNLRTHLHRGYGVDRVGSIHHLADVSAIDLCCVILRWRLAVHGEGGKDANSCKQQENDQDVFLIQLHFRCWSPRLRIEVSTY